MNWRWASLAALLAALVIGYGALNDRTAAPSIATQPPPQPGYFLHDAVITQTQADGSLGVRLSARRIEQTSADENIAMSGVLVNYFQAPGREWTLTAERGLVPPGSRVVQFEGDVQLRPADTPRTWLRTQALAIDMGRNVAYALDAPASLQFGQHAVTVQNFIADLNTGAVHLESVHGRFQSP